jgi:hypothetical protein
MGLVGYWLLTSALYTHAFTHPGCGEMGVVPTGVGIENTQDVTYPTIGKSAHKQYEAAGTPKTLWIVLTNQLLTNQLLTNQQARRWHQIDLSQFRVSAFHTSHIHTSRKGGIAYD